MTAVTFNNCGIRVIDYSMKKSQHPFHILQEVFELLPDAVLVVDGTGRIMFYNTQLAALLGYSSFELLAQSIDLIIPERFRQQHSAHVSDFFVRKQTRKMAAGTRLYALKKDGSEVQVDIALSPYEVAGTPYSIAVIRELSDKRYLEEKIGSLERTKEELERFACIVSHDLKAPVKRIHTLVDMILKDLPVEPGENLRELIGYLNQSISLTEKLISGILEQARTQHLQSIEIIPLDDVLKEVSQGIVIPENFVIRSMKALPEVRGNKTHWVQIFINLITNAMKYNDKEQGILEIDWTSDERFTIITFADNGMVVPENKRQSIFNMFTRGEHHPSDGSSHGIGLSIVKKITEAVGGNVEYQPSYLGGSAFRVQWPRF